MLNDGPLSLAVRVQEFFKKKGLTLSVAESCTGGLISHYITAVPGASGFFEGCAVTYSAHAKVRMLGVSEGVLGSFGAVSAETAAEMAGRARALLDTDFSLSTTGNLGPDALEGKERGLVYIGLASRTGEPQVIRLDLRGGRDENKQEAAFQALKFLLDAAKRGMRE
ncbi:MAG: CinA family protein [Nitrospiraceae bacterium]|nr:CinA family protein [Nitrospiraceae bacterium]